MKLFYILFISILTSQVIFSQSQLDNGDYYYSHKSYATAIPYYLSAFQSEPTAENALKLAKAYHKTRNFSSALEYADKSMAIDAIPASDREWYLNLLVENEQYKKAREFADINLTGANKVTFINKLDSIISWNNSSGAYQIVDLPFNTNFNDDVFVEANSKMGWISSDYVKDKKETPYFNVYPLKVDISKSLWKKNDSLKFDLSEFHDMITSYDSKNHEMYITRNFEKKNKLKGNKEKISNLKIYIIKLDEKYKIISSQDFPFNNEEYSVGHASINKSGDVLYFASDMPGGFGGTDIYRSRKVQGKWQNPENLGSTINTTANELFPYIATNGDLYYSTEGMNSIGGLDIVKSNYNSSNELFGKPVNMGPGINSNFDDFGISFIRSDFSMGYITSNRAGGQGGDDVYFIENNKADKEETKTLYTSIQTIDNKTQNDLSKVYVKLYSQSSPDDTFVGYTDENGLIDINVEEEKRYSLITSKSGYLTQVNHNIEFDQIPYVVRLDKKEVNMSFVIKDIYYEFDRADIHPSAFKELDKLAEFLNLNNDIIIELSSYTDSRGKEEYNMKLSQKRAENVVSYLVGKGVSPSRMLAKGYGDTRLVNRCTKFVECTEAEHAQNRRTEFKIVDLVNSKSISSQPSVNDAMKVALNPPVSGVVNISNASSNYTSSSTSYFTVQISASTKPPVLSKFANFKDVHVIQESNKYIVVAGKFDTKVEAENYRNILRNHVSDAYVLKIVDGRREFLR